jgi:hypothetical protein
VTVLIHVSDVACVQPIVRVNRPRRRFGLFK